MPTTDPNMTATPQRSQKRHQDKKQRLLRMLASHQRGETVIIDEDSPLVTRKHLEEKMKSLTVQDRAKLTVMLALRKLEKREMEETLSLKQVSDQINTPSNKVVQPRLARYAAEAELPPADKQIQPKVKADSPIHTIETPADPRWVLATKISEKMEGPILRPEYRDKLIRLGKSLGLSAFDGNMIIAILQDQARRGHLPSDCPAAGRSQLEMIQPQKAPHPLRKRVSFIVLLAITIELLLLGLYF